MLSTPVQLEHILINVLCLSKFFFNYCIKHNRGGLSRGSKGYFIIYVLHIQLSLHHIRNIIVNQKNRKLAFCPKCDQVLF